VPQKIFFPTLPVQICWVSNPSCCSSCRYRYGVAHLILFLSKRLNSLPILVQILNRFCQKKEDYELHLTPNLQYKRELLMQFGAPENTNGTDNFPKAGLFP
jgi:hypothetical protein